MVFRTLRVMSRARTWPMLTALLATSLCVAACKTKGVGSAREADVTYLDGPDRSPTFEASAKPGDNYEQAEFRLWLPDPTTPVRALVVLLPGSNDDGRDEVRDPFWHAFAVHHRLGLVGCRFVDKPHEPAFIEQYANASKGSGQALVDALGALARESSHAEIDAVQILLWGMSAGGEYDFEFAVWRPERVLAFVVNKGGVYYTALASQATRQTPALFFTGGKDLEFRTAVIEGLFALNRRAGALWAMVREPGLGHEVGRSRDLAAMFFEEILAARLPEGTMSPISISEAAGTIGDLKTFAITSAMGSAPTTPTAWLPSERFARQWQAVLGGRPFPPP
jgi:poly(3-hydroxybutyrate) depolymerase